MRDLDAAAEHPDAMPDWVRGTMRDGAAAIQRLTTLLKNRLSEDDRELVEQLQARAKQYRGAWGDLNPDLMSERAAERIIANSTRENP
jgi:hypothetical protein